MLGSVGGDTSEADGPTYYSNCAPRHDDQALFRGAFYHGWIMCLLLILDKDYYCKSNREAGNGRADVMLEPRPDCTGPGIIFEFKYCDKPGQLPGKAEEALRQIEEKRYIEEFPPEVKEVFGYGMSFCAKECNISHKAWKR